MKKVLIICDLFPPAFGPRMGYLCKYLKTKGWQPVVLTEKVDEHTFTFLTGNCPITYINYYTAKGKWTRRLQWIWTFFFDFCFGYKDRKMYKKACELIGTYQIDLLLCSTYRTFPLPAAQRAARKYKLPFVADLRDIIEQYTGNEFITHALPAFCGLDNIFAGLFKRKSLYERNKALKAAHFVTTVSPWHVEIMKQYNSHVELIYNGFDPELFYPEQIPTRQFVITYTGRLLSIAMRDPGLLLEALAILSSERVFSPTECRVLWYVDDASREVIIAEAKEKRVLPFMEFKAYVPASEIPKVLNNSSILLLLTNKASGSGPKGVMTTKFFESLAVGKPVLCVRSDESCLEAAIQESHAGLAARHVEEVCDFLRHYYTEWKKKGYTTSPIHSEVLNSYSRKEQAGQFVRIFDTLINNE